MILTAKTMPTVNSFNDLFAHAIALVRSIEHGKKTMVLGPVTAQNPEMIQENLEQLLSHAEQLSEDGWAVLELTPFQPLVEEIKKKLKIRDYPYGILHDFTIPLIESRCFDALHFRKNYSESFGATLEHDVAIGANIPIYYLP